MSSAPLPSASSDERPARDRRRVIRGLGAGVPLAAAASAPSLAQAAGSATLPPSRHAQDRGHHHGGHGHGGHGHGGHGHGHGLLPRRDRHLVTRFSYGVTPALAEQVKKAGGGQEWFEQQVHRSRRTDPVLAAYKAWFPNLSLSPAQLWARQISMVEGGGVVMRDYERWVLLRRLHTDQQLAEVMTEFWENHFNVPALGDPAFVYRTDYGETIRAHALDSFATLLRKAALHPAMLIYLNAADSTKSHPNENLGRELMELHTVGVENYDEHDVLASSRILTGWSLDAYRTWAPEYNKADHYTGKVRVKGFKAKNKKAKGKKLTKKYLRYLAFHPDTAHRIAEKLVLKFVGDRGNRRLVSHLAEVYLENDTEIVPVLRELIASREFRRSVGDKVRDPGEDIVATYRALQIKVAPPAGPTDIRSAVGAMVFQASIIGIAPFYWGGPDGQPIDNLTWSSPGRMLGSATMHWSLASANWPSLGVQYVPWTSWMPSSQCRFEDLVDHVSRQLMQKHVRGLLLDACCTCSGLQRETLVDRADPKLASIMPRVIATLLDSPDFMTR